MATTYQIELAASSGETTIISVIDEPLLDLPFDKWTGDAAAVSAGGGAVSYWEKNGGTLMGTDSVQILLHEFKKATQKGDSNTGLLTYITGEGTFPDGTLNWRCLARD